MCSLQQFVISYFQQGLQQVLGSMSHCVSQLVRCSCVFFQATSHCVVRRSSTTPDSTNRLLAKFYPVFLVQQLSVRQKLTILEDNLKNENTPKTACRRVYPARANTTLVVLVLNNSIQKATYQLRQVTFSSFDWDILISSFQKIP